MLRLSIGGEEEGVGGQGGDVTEVMEGEEAEYILHKSVQDCAGKRGNSTLRKTSLKHQYLLEKFLPEFL